MGIFKQSMLIKLFGIALSLALPVSQAVAQNSGKIGAVNPDATGTPPGGAARTLVIGNSVAQKERIQTSAQGTAQILFPDQSTLNVGRNSSIVIDTYIYDPKTGTGSMLTSVSKGVMRFVGGQISHNQGVTVKTPAATMGIRGGSGTVVFPLPEALAGSDPNLVNYGGTLVISHIGSITVGNNTGQVTIRPGFATYINGPNAPIGEPFRISDAVMARIAALLTSSATQTGGLSNANTQTFVIRDGVGSVVPNDPMRPPGADPLGYTSIIGSGNAVVRSQAQSNQVQNAPQPPAPQPPAAPPSRYNPSPNPNPNPRPTPGPQGER